MKKIISFILSVFACITMLSACGNKESSLSTEDGKYKLTFAQSIDIDTINSLNGKDVVITGYMATLSPVSGKFMYLMNLPYQSCPYCVPNTSQLSNTIAVYAKNNKSFQFTDGPIKVTGKLEIGDFSDEYSYEYKYRIVDASYTEVDTSDISENMLLWQKITDDGLASDLYAMFDYIDFMCRWPDYTAKFDGENDSYLYPDDVAHFQENQFTKESGENYFKELKARAENIDADKLSDLIQIINKAEALVNQAQAQIDNKKYTYLQDQDRYLLNNAEELANQAKNLYVEYANWLEMFSA